MVHIAPSCGDPCVWMAAGLVSYKLCDREFDCARCPLDGALRGGGLAKTDGALLAAASRRGHGFPDDRRYAAGHTWAASEHTGADPTVRIGVDAFAAVLLPRPIGVSCAATPDALRRGDVLCDIELPNGRVSLVAPFGGRIRQHNAVLRLRPEAIVESPYGDGWLLDVQPTPGESLDALLDAEEARQQAALHLRHFRRRVALHLLNDTADAVGPSMADGGEALTSLSDILGARQYLEILREVLR